MKRPGISSSGPGHLETIQIGKIPISQPLFALIEFFRLYPISCIFSDVNIENVALPEDEMRLPLVKIAAVDNTLPKTSGLEEGMGMAAGVENVVEMELELEPSDIDFCTNMEEK